MNRDREFSKAKLVDIFTVLNDKNPPQFDAVNDIPLGFHGTFKWPDYTDVNDP